MSEDREFLLPRSSKAEVGWSCFNNDKDRFYTAWQVCNTSVNDHLDILTVHIALTKTQSDI